MGVAIIDFFAGCIVYELNSTDKFWYSIGGAFALLIVVGLFVGSIGKVHPNKHVSDRLNRAKERADEALTEGMKAMNGAASMKSKVDTMVNESMKEFRSR